MWIQYASDGEYTTLMQLDDLIDNLNTTKGWMFGHNATDMRTELDERGWYEGTHDCGRYIVLNLDKLELTSRLQPASDTYSDILQILADNDGACLYWQMPNVKRGREALRAGVIKDDGDLLVHPDAIQIEAGMAYTMEK